MRAPVDGRSGPLSESPTRVLPPPPASLPGRARTIAALAVPIVGAMLSQNLLNVVDTAMVGSLGDAALAATGTGSFANFMAGAFVMGLSSGVQAMAARRVGEGRESEAAVPLNGALLLALALGLPLTVALVAAAPFLFLLLNDDPAVVGQGVPYLQARLLALVAVGMNFSFRGFWNGVNQPGLYLRALLVMHGVNLFLNWVLIFGHLGAPALGAPGSGIASAVATYAGTAVYAWEGFAYARSRGFLRGLPDGKAVRTMLRLAIPNGIQQFLFAAGYTALFWILARVGTRETAAANVLVNVMLVAILPALALGLAAASLVGQALGRGDPKDARRWGWEISLLAAVLMSGFGILMASFPDPLLGIFLHDPETLAVARGPLRLFGVTIGADAAGIVLLNALLGAGASRLVLALSAGLQWGLFLPAAYLVGPHLGYGLLGIWICNVAWRLLNTAAVALAWGRGSWSRIVV